MAATNGVLVVDDELQAMADAGDDDWIEQVYRSVEDIPDDAGYFSLIISKGTGGE